MTLRAKYILIACTGIIRTPSVISGNQRQIYRFRTDSLILSETNTRRIGERGRPSIMKCPFVIIKIVFVTNYSS